MNEPTWGPKRVRDSPPPFQSATVVGLGGVGRMVAVQLAGLGVEQLKLIDARTVARTTCTAEGYAVEDVGRRRVHAAAQQCHETDPRLEIVTASRYSPGGVDGGGGLFCCPGPSSVWPTLKQRAPAYALVAHAEIRGSLVQLHFARDVKRLAERILADKATENRKRVRSSVSVQAYLMALAAGLLVGGAVKFARGKAATWLVRFDFEGFRLQSGGWR